MTSIELTTNPSWVPDACTLPTAEQPVRVREFDELLASAVTGAERTSPTSLRLTLTATPEVAAAAAGLAAREVRCCGFFTFTLTLAEQTAHLAIDVPAVRADVLDALYRRAGEARGR